MKKGLRLVFIFALLITLVACGDREIPTFDDILDQTINVGSDAQNWEDLLENLADNETPVEALVIEVDDNVNYDVPGTYNVTITVTDESDNVASVEFTVTVVDNVKPVISLVGQASMSLIAGESFTDPGATFTDNVDGTGNATVSGSVNTAVVGTYTLTYSYTDAAGNAADPVTRTVTVIPLDTQNPVITLTGDAVLTVEAGATFTDPGATFSDNLDGTGEAIASGSVDTSALGSYTLTYTYTDAQGNAATPVTRTVNVVDTTAPVIIVSQATYTVEVGSTFTLPTATASDNLDADVTVTATGTVDASTVGSYTLTYNFTDSEGNAALAVTVTVVVEDTTAPVVTLAGDASVTLEAGATFTDAGATATDNYDTTAPVVVSGTVNNAALGTYTLTYTSTDASGNVGTATRTVTVVDTTSPVITITGGASITVQIGETYTEQGATFTDNLDAAGNATVATTSDTVDTATVGTYTITYTVTDSSGNTATATRTVNVSDTPPRLAQYAPTDDSTFGINNYFKFGSIEAFLLSYSDKNLLVIFNGQEVLGEIEFGLEPNGPDSMPTSPMFGNIYAISENGLLIMSYDIMNDSQISTVFNLNTKQVIDDLPVGYVTYYATGPNQGPTSYLIDFEGYYYIVKSGDDKGIYTFNEDLTLTKHVSFTREYSNVYFNYKDEVYTLLEVSSYGQNYYSGTLLLDTQTYQLLQTYDNYVSRNLLGEKLVLSYYDNNEPNNNTTIHVWSSPTEMASLNASRVYYFNEESDVEYPPIYKAMSMAITYFDQENQENQVRIYDETFTLLSTTGYSQYSWSVEQNGDYIIVLDRDSSYNNSKILLIKNDGSEATTIDDFGMNTTNESVTSSDLQIYYGNSGGNPNNRPFENLYTVQGWDDDVENSVYKGFYFENGMMKAFDLPSSIHGSYNYFIENATKIFFTSRISDFTEGNTRLTAFIYDLETETLTTSPTLDLGFYGANTNSNFSYQDGYTLITFGEDNNYNSTKHFILYDVNANTLQLGSLDTALENATYIQNFTVEEDVVTVSFGSVALSTSISNFGDTFTEVTPTFGGGGSSVYEMPNIINEDDLKLEMSFGEMGPTLVITLNGVELLSVSVSNTSYQVYVYDAEGIENDTIFIGFRQLGYVIDLSDPGFTEYQGVVTSGGFLTLDENYNESFDVLPIDTSMFFEYFLYRID